MIRSDQSELSAIFAETKNSALNGWSGMLTTANPLERIPCFWLGELWTFFWSVSLACRLLNLFNHSFVFQFQRFLSL
jgi:hypothetical protein